MSAHDDTVYPLTRAHAIDDPQPVLCDACDGDCIEHYWDGRTTQTRPCQRCDGEGVVEP